jgi:excisionase family DNA binding protein
LQQEELISLAEAAQIAKMTPDHLRFLARNGSLRARKIGRNWLTTREAVLEYLKDPVKRSRDPYKRSR